MQIVQEISCRVNVKRTNEKNKIAYDISLRNQDFVLIFINIIY